MTGRRERGHLLRVRPVPPAGGAWAGVLTVTVEDVSLADEPSQVVATVSWPVEDLAGAVVELAAALAPYRHYTVRVHLAVRGGEGSRVRTGDLVGARPVPAAAGGVLTVPLAEVEPPP